MRITLRPFELTMGSIEDLGLEDEAKLQGLWREVKNLKGVAGVKYFGSGDTLHMVHEAKDVLTEFAKHKAERYSFADVASLQSGTPKAEWVLGIRRGLVTLTGVLTAEPQQLAEIADELPLQNDLVLKFAKKTTVYRPFSFVEAPDADFEEPARPLIFGRISIMGLVDITLDDGEYRDSEIKAVTALRSMTLPPHASREKHGQQVVVRWGDIGKESAEEILARRYSWYAEHGGLSRDPPERATRDSPYFLSAPQRTKELTAYDPVTGTGTKALVFDTPEETVPALEELAAILRRGRTSEGFPVSELVLIVPSRDAAVAIRPVIERYGLSRVVYVGDDDALWSPAIEAG